MNQSVILFVNKDDETINEIKEYFSNDLDRWNPLFAFNGIEALSILSSEAIDVLVTDIDTGEVSGLELIKTVIDKFPTAIRIVLSECQDPNVILSFSNVIHRYISLPCNIKTLKNTIANTLFMNISLDSDAIKKVIVKTTSLPSLPTVYRELMEKIDNPEFSLRDLSNIISKDVGLTVNILKHVNQLNLEQPINDINTAVSLLGIDSIKALALTTHSFYSVGNIDIKHFSLDGLFSLSINTGNLARLLVNKLNIENIDSEKAFIAGILHQIGTLIFATNFTNKYEYVLERVLTANRPLFAVERNIIGISSQELTAHILALWGVSEEVLYPIAYLFDYEVLDDDESISLKDILYISFHVMYSILYNDGVELFPIEKFDYQKDRYIISRNLIDLYEESYDIAQTIMES